MKEKELIRIITSTLNSEYIGDDCAYLKDLGIVVTQDSLVEGIHFRLDFTTPYQLGYKSAMVNISDVCASGAEPKYMTIALSLPKYVDENFVKEFYEGAKKACGDVKIVGGDLTGSDKLYISITAIGSIKDRKISSRSHAKKGYKIIVSGEHGNSAKGLNLLFKGKTKPEKFLHAHLKSKRQSNHKNMSLRAMSVAIPLKSNIMRLLRHFVPRNDKTNDNKFINAHLKPERRSNHKAMSLRAMSVAIPLKSNTMRLLRHFVPRNDKTNDNKFINAHLKPERHSNHKTMSLRAMSVAIPLKLNIMRLLRHFVPRNDKSNDSKFINAHLMPEAQREFSQHIAENIQKDYAMMDTSDGLADALIQIAKASGVTISVDTSKIPHDPDVNMETVLYGGEDYQLVAAVPEDFTFDYPIIGEVKEGTAGIEIDGKFYESLDEKLYNHFEEKNEP